MYNMEKDIKQILSLQLYIYFVIDILIYMSYNLKHKSNGAYLFIDKRISAVFYFHINEIIINFFNYLFQSSLRLNKLI